MNISLPTGFGKPAQLYGDLFVAREPGPRLNRALAVIGSFLHRDFDTLPWIAKDKSKESCVLSALTVRDFLQQAGFYDACVRPVSTIIRADQNDEQLHSLGIGITTDKKKRIVNGRWVGHLVVTTSGLMIDPTLYQAMRPQWPMLPGMIALPVLDAVETRILDMTPLASIMFKDGGYELNAAWLDNPKNQWWRKGEDTKRGRRLGVVSALLQRFTTWPE